MCKRTGSGVQRAKSENTVSDFLKWKQEIEAEWNDHTKQDYYLARVCWLLYRLHFILGGKPEKVEDDFLLKFNKTKQVDAELEEELKKRSAEQAAAIQKASILAWVGLDADGQPLPHLAARMKKDPPKPAKKPPPRKPSGGVKKPGKR